MQPSEVPCVVAFCRVEPGQPCRGALSTPLSQWHSERIRTAEIITAELDRHEAMVRAKVAEDMRRASAGRRHYAASWPQGAPTREYLEAEADTFDSAARLAEGDIATMCAVLPVIMWGPAEEAYTRGEGQ